MTENPLQAWCVLYTEKYADQGCNSNPPRGGVRRIGSYLVEAHSSDEAISEAFRRFLADDRNPTPRQTYFDWICRRGGASREWHPGSDEESIEQSIARWVNIDPEMVEVDPDGQVRLSSNRLDEEGMAALVRWMRP